MSRPRVLVVLNTDAAWSRGILRGFMEQARERDWTLLHYHTVSSLTWLASEWVPAVAVIGPELDGDALLPLARTPLVSVTVDRTHRGIASVCPDEESVAALALDHLLATGLRRVSTFRFDESEFAIARERAFVERALAAGVGVAAGWGSGDRVPTERGEDPAAIIAWLEKLPKPCGIFSCTDGWGRTVARYAQAAGLRVPEDLALVGADNDALECELISPPLSSMVIPWQEVGKGAATLVRLALSGKSIEGSRLVVSPIGVVARRSSDVLAIDDALVRKAVRYIRENADRRIGVTMVARAMGGGRQRLERRFRAALDRTVQEEIRRAHVDVAKRLLATTGTDLREIAKQSGFTNAALLNAAFRRELGTTPGVYRRRMQKESAHPDDG